ncbi:hypothetical protein NUW58_g7906 [Xylaria curta]|uniref:Uncharacterized protein n=1 Tax=Xylaria curta TaxID=42375 RepID=A0ACC1NE90_9PEZI|nr:hypothetical protein NUW58_g7906 [Xylaria curta]
MASGSGPPPPLGSQGMVPQPVVQQPVAQQPAAQQPPNSATSAPDADAAYVPLGLAPTLHPKYYGDIPEAEDYGVFSSGYEKDKFLCSEFWFLEHMKGQPSWQLGPINRSLQFSTRGFVPGGHIYSLDGEAHIHNLIYETERIQVDESTWFPFFKKSRWYGSAEADWAFGGGPWTVDNPRRQTYNTMLFGKLGYWTQAAFLHAFLFVRERTDTDITLTALDRNNPTWDEPFVDFGASAELGYASYNATDFIPIGLHLATWPFPTLSQGMSALGAKAEGHPEFAQGAENRLIAIPAIWFSRILSEEFWQDKMIRKSDNNFHLIDHFSSRVHHKPNIPIWEYRAAPVIERQRELEEQQLRKELNEGMVDMITHWVHNENRALLVSNSAGNLLSIPAVETTLTRDGVVWKEARAGWYDDLKATSERLGEVWFFSHRLLTAVTFKDSTYQEYTGYLKSNPVRGIWHAVGLLMCAAIPIRTFDMTKNTPTLELAIDIHSSDAAPTKVTKQIKRPLEWGTKDSAPASIFSDPLMRPGQTFTYGSFTQFDYLDLVVKLIRFWAQDGQPIPTPWLLEIQRVESGLRAKLLTNFNSPHLSALNWWADEAWDLAIPEFGTAMSRWNQTTQQWESV